MADVADYIVYMTYDLHGQWNYANKHAIDGCPAVNCLRSQTNITETLLALSMTTKAGVPSNKVAVGVTSYGRSFQMTTPDCTGPMCTYTGGESGAYPGPCTGLQVISPMTKSRPSLGEPELGKHHLEPCNRFHPIRRVLTKTVIRTLRCTIPRSGSHIWTTKSKQIGP